MGTAVVPSTHPSRPPLTPAWKSAAATRIFRSPSASVLARSSTVVSRITAAAANARSAGLSRVWGKRQGAGAGPERARGLSIPSRVADGAEASKSRAEVSKSRLIKAFLSPAAAASSSFVRKASIRPCRGRRRCVATGRDDAIGTAAAARGPGPSCVSRICLESVWNLSGIRSGTPRTTSPNARASSARTSSSWSMGGLIHPWTAPPSAPPSPSSSSSSSSSSSLLSESRRGRRRLESMSATAARFDCSSPPPVFGPRRLLPFPYPSPRSFDMLSPLTPAVRSWLPSLCSDKPPSSTSNPD